LRVHTSPPPPTIDVGVVPTGITDTTAPFVGSITATEFGPAMTGSASPRVTTNATTSATHAATSPATTKPTDLLRDLDR